MDNYLKYSWLFIFIIFMLLISYYTIYKVNSCTSDPLTYKYNELKEAYGKGAIVSGMITISNVSKFTSPVIRFGDINDSSGIIETSYKQTAEQRGLLINFSR